MVEQSIGIVTALNPYTGYANSTAITQEALERGLLTREQLDDVLKPEHMTRPRLDPTLPKQE
jgi:aspartate ammonia-lyase